MGKAGAGRRPGSSDGGDRRASASRDKKGSGGAEGAAEGKGGQQGAGKGQQGGLQGQEQQQEGASLYADLAGVIDGCTAAVRAAASAYYSKKVIIGLERDWRWHPYAQAWCENAPCFSQATAFHSFPARVCFLATALPSLTHTFVLSVERTLSLLMPYPTVTATCLAGSLLYLTACQHLCRPNPVCRCLACTGGYPPHPLPRQNPRHPGRPPVCHQ